MRIADSPFTDESPRPLNLSLGRCWAYTGPAGTTDAENYGLFHARHRTPSEHNRSRHDYTKHGVAGVIATLRQQPHNFGIADLRARLQLPENM